jgi:hypothetical protein
LGVPLQRKLDPQIERNLKSLCNSDGSDLHDGARAHIRVLHTDAYPGRRQTE